MAEMTNPPPGWNDDPLAEFLELARHNIFSSFTLNKSWYDKLLEIHELYEDLKENLDSTQDLFAAFFLFRAHSAYLGSARMILSGQVPETHVMLRSCLEYAMYGLYVSKHPESQKIWLRRSDDDETRNRMRNLFTIRNMKECLQSEDIETYDVATQLYERTIDYGGHPNPDGVLGFATMTENPNERIIDSGYLTPLTPAYDLAIKSTAQIGVCSLSIFENVYETRFDLLLLSDRLEKLRHGL